MDHTAAGITAAVQKRHSGAPRQAIEEALLALERDGEVYRDEQESARCGKTIWRISEKGKRRLNATCVLACPPISPQPHP